MSGSRSVLDDEDPNDDKPAWEPEPLHLPIEAPPPPCGRTDEDPVDERGTGVLVIDLA